MARVSGKYMLLFLFHSGGTGTSGFLKLKNQNTWLVIMEIIFF